MPSVRKDAAKSFGKVQGDNIAVFSLITNTLVKDKEIDDRWRKYRGRNRSATSPTWSRTRWSMRWRRR